MRSLLPLIAVVCAGLVACAPKDDDAVTGDEAELVEGRIGLERELSPAVAAPTPAVIGKTTTEALAEATTGARSLGVRNVADGCSIERFENPTTKAIVVEREVCKSSEIITVLDADGRDEAVYGDLNRDGKIDRFTGEDGAFISYADHNFDGKVDATVERVDRIKGFSLSGYDEKFPTSRFVHRMREDRNRDGKLDHEKILAKSLLPPAPR